MWDAPQGYHQICIAKESQEKLAFAGPNATKWTYNVMPFGPVNGPSTFVAFIHDMDGTWKDVAHSLGIVIDKDMDTTIIVDDIVSWAKQVTAALLYMECQLRVCQSQNLSLSLKNPTFSPNVSNLSASMYLLTAIVPPCPSTPCFTTGHPQNWSGMSPNLLALPNFIPALFPNSNSASALCVI
jgi:hypothetical protein